MVRNHQSDTRERITYWIVTGFLVFAMMAGGLAQFIQAKFNTDGFIRLGYPLYSMKHPAESRPAQPASRQRMKTSFLCQRCPELTRYN